MRRRLLKRSAMMLVLSMLPALIMGTGALGPAWGAAPPPSPFTTPVLVNGYTTGQQTVPVVNLLHNDDLFVAWQDTRSGNEDIYSSTSSDNGTTFATNTRVDDSYGSSRQIEPSVAVSKNGTVLVAWQDNRRSTIDYDIFFSKSYDGGSKFTRNVKVDDSNSTVSWQERPSVAVTSKDVIYIIWTDDRTGVLRIRGAHSTDFGATFSPSAEIVRPGDGGGQTGGVVVANDRRLFVAFMDNVTGTPHPYVCISTNGGQSFSSPMRLDDTGDKGVFQRGIVIAPMPSGGVVAVWEDSRNGGWDLYGCVVSKTGAILIPDFRVDDDTSAAYQRNACVVSDQVGNIYAVWEDERNNAFSVRFAYAESGEDRFTASIEIAKPGSEDMQRRPSIVSVEPGRVFVTWQDDKSGTYDVYCSAGYFPDLFRLHLESTWNFVSIYVEGTTYKASTLGLAYGDVVVGWDSESQSYNQYYIVGISSPSSDFPILTNTGYWIYAGVDETLALTGCVPTSSQSKQFDVPSEGGWIIVSFASLNMTRHASDIPQMYSVAGSISCVASYDVYTQTYVVYYVGIPSTDYSLVPGQAYWCWCKSSGTLTYDP
jgi:hypothetical protein